MTHIMDTAIDYLERKLHITLLERPGDELPTLDNLSGELKAHLRKGSDLTVTRTDPRTGEIVNALEVPEKNVRLFLRDSPATYKTCANCGAEIQTRARSQALVQEPIVDMMAAARAEQWKPLP